MRRYLDDPELARRHGATACERAEQNFAIENTVKRLYSVYEQVFHTVA